MPRGVDLLALAAQSPPLHEVLDHLAEHVATACGADVAALVLRGGTWRVLAGRGLRALEWRAIEELPHALASLSVRQPVLSVEDTDAVRSGVLGAPLSRHRSLLLLRPLSPLILVLGRDRPFEGSDVHGVRALVDAQQEALDVAFGLAEAADALERHRLG